MMKKHGLFITQMGFSFFEVPLFLDNPQFFLAEKLVFFPRGSEDPQILSRQFRSRPHALTKIPKM